MTGTQTWHREHRGAVCVLTLVHPPRNEVTYADMEALELQLDAAEQAQARVVVLTGGVDGYFIGHADLDDLLALRGDEETSGDGVAWGRVLRRLDRGPLVSIAAVNGQAWGGGSELALTCNLRFAAASASFGFPEVSLGIIPGVGAHRAVRLLPEHLAFELLATGQPVTATRADRLGLLNGVTEDGTVVDLAVEVAECLAAKPSDAVRAVRELVVEHRDSTSKDLQRRQLQLFLELLHTDTAGRLLRTARDHYRTGAAPYDALGL